MMTLSVLRKILVVMLAVMMTRVPQLHAAAQVEGQMISTVEWVNEQGRKEMIEKVNHFLSRQEVATQLSQHGVSASEAQGHIASLSDAELQNLSHEIDNATYGGDGVVGILVVVLLVVLIIYLVKRI
jgi:hypothetical protein